MASEYLLWKYRDIKPDAPVEYTRRQRLENWLYYHKWHLILGAVLLLIAADIGKDMLGIGKIKPDYQVAYVASAPLPADTAAALETALAALGTDQNNDGRVTVTLHQYPLSAAEAETGSAYYSSAAQVTLMGDLESCDSFLFLLEDYETFQAGYQALAAADGSLAEGRSPVEHYRWADCPTLAGLQLGSYEEIILGETVSGESQPLLANLTVARRGVTDHRAPQYPEACEALWNIIKEGAAS